MSDGTAIQWTDASWTPIRAKYSTTDDVGQVLKTGWHCERVSPGCQHCYAERLNEKRFGTGLPYNRKSRDMVEVYLDEEALVQPLRWRKPRRIFVCSMTDLFGEWVPDEMIDRVFAVMALSPQHTFQVLTKRPERMREYVSEESFGAAERVWGEWDNIVGSPVAAEWPGWPLPNVWLGVSAEDQDRAEMRIPKLLATPAAVRFLSCEPLLGPVDLATHKALNQDGSLIGWRIPNGIDWIIVGGESGPGARRCHVGWIRSIVRQGQVARVPVFVKQVGARPIGLPPPDSWHGLKRPEIRLRDRAGGDPAEWPEDLRVCQYPEVGR